MLIQASTPQPVINMFALPENIVVMTLERSITSDGALLVNTEPDFAYGRDVPRSRSLTLDVPGFVVHEYVVPFQDLVGSRGWEGGRGFFFRARSAFRQSAAEYQQREMDFYVTFPPNGGGIVRFGTFDFANPRLNFNAGFPLIGSINEEQRDEFRERVSDANLLIAFNRVHQGGTSQQVDDAARRRASRIASFQESFQEVGEGDRIRSPELVEAPLNRPVRPIQPMTARPDPLPRYMRDLGLEE